MTSEVALLDRAMKALGLSDFGDDGFRADRGSCRHGFWALSTALRRILL